MFALSNAREFSFSQVHTVTEGAKESIRINGVPVLSRSCYENKKDPF